MAGKFILAHDLGTTGNKASLFDDQGKVLASVFHPYETSYPHPGWVEQNPEDWWQAACISTYNLIAAARVARQDIACIVFSGQMMGCVAVDRQANPLRPAIIWADTRAVEEERWIIERAGMQETYQITGHRASASYSAAKMLWIRNHQPDTYAKAHKFLHAKDFIAARLTGNFATDTSDASGMNLYDLRRQEWSQTLLDAFLIDPKVLPELHASTDVIGKVGASVAEDIGLAAGTPVVIGGGDGSCAATGAGVVREGSAYLYIGSSAWIGIATQEPIFDPNLRTFTWAHLVPGLFSPTGTMQAAGGSYQWLRDTLCQPEKDTADALNLSAYDLMNRLAEQSPPGANGLLFFPYLLGERSPRWNPDARGVYFGLSMAHTRADIIRATLEGITLNLRVILDAFRDQGALIPSMRVIGGGAKGAIWRQILADVFSMPIQQPALLAEATSLGAALAGGIGVGLYPGFDLVDELTPITGVTYPDPTRTALYDRLYEIFNQSYQAFVPVYQALSARA